MSYTHITEWERWQIYGYLQEWHSIPKVSRLLSRPKKTIYVEINRNSVNWVYMPAYAQRLYEKRRSEINKWRRKLKHHPEMIHIIRSRLKEDKWMPDSITGYMKLQWLPFVSTQTIYDYIDEYEPQLKKYLKYKRWYRSKQKHESRNIKQWFISIEKRPKLVEDRERIWDREVDTVVSSWNERKWWCVTMVDRKTKFVVWGVAQQKTKEAVADILIREWRKLPKQKLFTITSDNGKEFNDFKRVKKKLRIQMYFAHPYSSYERWTNEQTNGMLRVFYPKGTDFTRVSEEEFQKVLQIINRKPRKSLWYLCAYEEFHGVRLNL
jgi:IS30 family transposase